MSDVTEVISVSERAPDVLLYLRSRIEFSNGAPAGWFTTYLGALDHVVHGVWQAEIQEARRTFPELPPVAIDASLERLRRWRGRHLRLVDADGGPIIITAAVLGTAYWILERTMSEALGEDFTGAMSRQLVRWSLGRLDDIALTIVADLKKHLRQKKITATVKAPQRSADQVPIIAISTRAPDEDTPLLPPASLMLPALDQDPRQMALPMLGLAPPSPAPPAPNGNESDSVRPSRPAAPAEAPEQQQLLIGFSKKKKP